MDDELPPLLRAVTRGATVLLLLGLVVALAVGIAPNASTRVVALGEGLWPGYAAELRADPEAPACDPAELEARLAACPAEAPEGGRDAHPTGDAATDPFGGADPFAAPEPAGGDPFGGDDPFAAPEPAGGDPFGGADPFAAGGDAERPAEVNCPALRALHAQCVAGHARFDETSARLTPTIRAFRAVDLRIGNIARFPWWADLLSVVLLLGAVTTTATRMHIALRNPRTPREHAISQGAQLVAHLFLVASAFADWRVQSTSTAEIASPQLAVIWAVGFSLLAGLNVYNLLRPPPASAPEGGLGRWLMVVPLYAWMVVIAGLWFQLVEQHPSGQAIFLHKFVQVPTVYLGIGLYVWAGMLLAETRIARLVFALLTPWRLPPALLAWLVVVLSAVPTAYSGASGIFVIAAGAVIFDQLRAAGAPKRLALAATAMSGSLGVVLRPCLVVVLIAVLNKQVTTDELFGWGLWVFAFTSVLFLVAMLLRNDQPIRLAAPAQALPAVGDALRALVPYVLVGAAILVGYWLLFDTGLNERTAPFVLPVLLLALVVYDRVRAPETHAEIHHAPGGAVPAVVDATRESAHHVGALLLVMAGSVGLGGVVERSNLMAVMPASLGSVWVTMLVLVLILVLVGMTMDALGAVVLVTVTVAQVAYANGIHPVHFWMTVLVAFELGYLTPPVALNHLLARQVIGRDAEVEHERTGRFWADHEHLLVPVAVMGVALVVVAFAPLPFYG